ncbi:glycine betaine ABC transporter substrate-binding protein [Lentibacillus amyloliquefaciens]|uniref:Glycine/betaine ABC transporter substrate-binding protein n=1 Tax=Lentibacillus amyloliquefaciens TaxID=1472767 RepID=A0A0U4EHV7_9BACI|nr:glycine betaine ABC transporter substrate-binding protein [Lentibacillus amyloliquefaciens]ALX50057.1 glycine/betaine ABC transporter substrate-binding protein [Lentibacillus amyloliquefaciens]
MKKTLFILITILFSIAMYGCSSSGDTDNAGDTGSEDKPTLTFGVTNWTSTVPPTKIAGKILENMGYKVEETNADAGSVYTGMSNGDIDIFMDSWFPAQRQYIEEYSDSIESIGVSYDNANSGMVVPKYMEDINDVSDLKGNEDLVNNEMFAIGAGDPAMQDMKKVIDFYNLDIEMTNSSEAAMLAAAEAEMEEENPVLFYGWRPHSMFDKYDLKILTNKEATEEKGLFDASTINVIANKGLEEKAPEAFQFLSNWSISMEDMEQMIAEIDGGANPDEVAQEWIDNNQDKIEEMKNGN